MHMQKLEKLLAKKMLSATSLMMPLRVHAKRAFWVMAGLPEQDVMKVKSQDQIQCVCLQSKCLENVY